MVQEFHVLRCFSCQTFQVQQVKKSKKWTCKVCGEKQSVIKEYGRGAAADCRRHVQKLNSLHGELLNVNSERVLSQWEQGTDDQNRSVIEDWNSNKLEKVDSISRWSKYIDQKTEDPKQDGEENIYTERDQFRNKETRKRKLVSKLKSVGDHYCEHEDSYTGFRGVKRQPYQLLQHDGMLSSSWNKEYFSLDDSKEDVSCTSTHLPLHPQAANSYPSASTSYKHTPANSSKVQCNFSHNQERVKVPKYLPQLNQDPSTPSSNKTFTESKRKNNDSKWNKFLTAVPSQEKDDMSHHLPSLAFVDNTAVFESTEPLTDIYSEEHSCPPVEKTDTGVPGRQTSANSFYRISSHTVNSEAAGFEKTVCKQPLQTNRSCPGFSSNSLFFTDEDFDDTL